MVITRGQMTRLIVFIENRMKLGVAPDVERGIGGPDNCGMCETGVSVVFCDGIVYRQACMVLEVSL